MCKFQTLAAAVALSAMAVMAHAEGHASGWTLDPALSNVSYGSIKNDYTGESNTFGDIRGTVTADGVVTISIDLSSVQTSIDIRNERMIEHVFQNGPTATVTAKLDMATLADLEAGEATTLETSGTLNLIGIETDLDAALFVMRLSADKVLVTTDGMIMLSTEDAGLDLGIDMLQELAGLDSITRVSPVTMRLVFDAGS